MLDGGGSFSQVMSFMIGRWCNGNTTGFGPVIWGSNPYRPAILTRLFVRRVFYGGIGLVKGVVQLTDGGAFD